MFADIELPRKPGEVNIHRIFFDPTGNHLLVTSIQGENFYFYSRWKKAKALPKFKVWHAELYILMSYLSGLDH